MPTTSFSTPFILAGAFFIIFCVVQGQIIENNSTNFHNLLWSRKNHFNRYHSYFFDYWKTIDFDKFFQNLRQDSTFNESMTEDEILADLKHDDEKDSLITKVASLCGRLRNASSPFISDDCFKDLDFVACTLFDFIRDLRSFMKGSCTYLSSPKEIELCNERMKKKLVDNLWPVYMLDSFGKLPAGLNMGNHMPLGRYSDCKSIMVPRPDFKGARPFEANYCRATFRIPLPETAAEITRQCHGEDSLINGFNRTCKPSINFARMKWGICAPSSCNTRNMTVLFRFMIFPTKHFCNVTVACESKLEPAKDRFLIGVLLIFGVVLLCAILGTGYDLIFYQPVVEYLHEEKYEDNNKELSEANGNNNNNNRTSGDIDDKKNIALRSNMGMSRKEYYTSLKPFYKFLLAYSVYTNGQRILDTEDSPKEFKVVNALRSLSTIWTVVILAHIFIISYVDNIKALPKFVASFWHQGINNGSFVSDTFLLLAGFLLAYWFLKRVHDAKEIFSAKFWTRYYAKRFIRFFPPYFALLLIFLFVWKYFIQGPMWTIYFFNPCSPLNCKNSLWTNILFLNNFLQTKTPCFPIMQLLTLDVQLQFLAPPLLICLLKFPKVSVILSCSLILCSSLLQVALALIYDLPPSLMANADIYSLDKPLSRYYNVIFIKPYARWNAFLIGMLLGQAVIRKPNFLHTLTKKYTKLIWLVAILTCGFVIYGLQFYAKNKSIGQVEFIAYVALSRLSWSIAVATILYMCLIDRGGVIQWFFEQPFWAPLSRLSYSAFLVGPLVVLYGYVTSKSTFHMTSYNLTYFSIGCTVMTFLFAFAFHLLFEAPFLQFRHMWTQTFTSEYHIVSTDATTKGHKNVPLRLMGNVHKDHDSPHEVKKKQHYSARTKDDGTNLSPTKVTINESSTAKLKANYV